MEDFRYHEQIRVWLETQSRGVISVFAARAALRVLPRLSRQIKKQEGKLPLSAFSQSIFWATSVSLSSGNWMARSGGLPLGDAGATFAPIYAAAAYAANFAATAHFKSDATKAAAHAADYAANSTIDATNASASTANAAFGEYDRDRDFIMREESAQALAKTSLWSDQSTNAYKDLSQNWAELKSYLLTQNENWWVWTDWYEDRLRGNAEQPFKLPFVEEVEIGGDFENGEYGRCTLPKEFYKDPAKANAAIAEIIEAYWAKQGALDQDTTVETFGPNSEGIIDRTTAQTSPGLTDTPEQRDWYDSLRNAALGMKDIGENALGRAARPVNNLVKAMPEDMAEAKIAKLWPAANRIRKLKAAHDRAAAGPENYHPNLLGSEVIDDVDQFVEVYNNFVVGDASLSEKDSNTAGPQDPDTEIKASEAADDVIDIAREHGLFTQEAEEVLTETTAENQEIIAELKNGNPLTVLENLALDNTRREKENVLRAIIIRVRDSERYGKIEDGALKAIGTSIIAAISYGMYQLLPLVTRLFG